MPVDVFWLVETRVSYFKYSGTISLEELQAASDYGTTLLERSPDSLLVHSIQDSADIDEFPTNLRKVQQITQGSLAHPRMGWLISVGIENPLILYIASMIGKLLRIRQRFVPSLDEAFALLHHVDPTLPDLTQIDLDQLDLLIHIDLSIEPDITHSMN